MLALNPFMTSTPLEFFYENIRIHLDIADDYVHEEACIVNELLAELQRMESSTHDPLSQIPARCSRDWLNCQNKEQKAATVQKCSCFSHHSET